MFKSEIFKRENLRAFIKTSGGSQLIHATGNEYEKAYRQIKRKSEGARKAALHELPVGHKLNEMLFFVKEQKKSSVLFASQNFKHLFKLIEALDLDFVAPFFEFSWFKQYLEIHGTIRELNKQIEKYDLLKRETFLPIFLPKAESGKDQGHMAEFFQELLPYLNKIRCLILTDENVRLFLTAEYKELYRKKIIHRKEYYDRWNTILERPVFQETRGKDGTLLVPRFIVPFTNFVDDSYLMQGEPRRPGDITSSTQFNPDVHVTLTSILGRMGLHRKDKDTNEDTYEDEYQNNKEYQKLMGDQEHSKSNFLFYSIYYSHLSYIVSNPPHREVALPTEAIHTVLNASPEPVRIFILARLVSKYRLPTHCLFSMIETLEKAHKKFHAPGASQKFKMILQQAVEAAKVGKKRGDFSLVLGRMYLYQTKEKYKEAVKKLHDRAELNPEFKQTLREDEALLSDKFQQMAMDQYIKNLHVLVDSDHAAFDFFINGMLISNFGKFYPSFPGLYVEWLVSEFAELSRLIHKQIREQDRETFASTGIMPEFVLAELGLSQYVQKEGQVSDQPAIGLSGDPTEFSSATPKEKREIDVNFNSDPDGLAMVENLDFDLDMQDSALSASGLSI